MSDGGTCIQNPVESTSDPSEPVKTAARFDDLGNSPIQNPHTRCIESELAWLSRILEQRLASHLEGENDENLIDRIPPPTLQETAAYARLLQRFGFGRDERLVLILAMAPHLRPQLLDCLMVVNIAVNRGYSEFGGWEGKQHGGFLPTCETAVFLLAGYRLDRRLQAQRLFESNHPLLREGLLQLHPPEPKEPFLSSLLSMPAEVVLRLATGENRQDISTGRFPAKQLTTRLEWEDLVLPEHVKTEIDRVHSWSVFGDILMDRWGLAKILQPGYRVLFYGPPGTGKTLAACLLGKRVDAPVYRIDLSLLVSKYIGETEKNLASLFDQARSKNWILFFDEADTLFGKRTAAATVNDRHANQETAYLLQRIEDHPGIVILATNLKDNIDDAFFRRFQSVIYFPIPDTEHRLRLWRQGLKNTPTEGLDLNRIAADFVLSGGSITNVIRHAALCALEQGRRAVNQQDLLEAIGRKSHEITKTANPNRPAVMLRGPLASK
ncbi:MAG: ATP-binding protein [Acidobacteriota bacterium]|nr:ATP-binding protein [Acidobacteriota bacterium]